MGTRKSFGDGAARTVLVINIAAVLVLALTARVLANETFVLAAGQGFEVALAGTGSHFAPAPQGTFLAEDSEVRTGKTGWAILRLSNDTQVELRADSEVAFPSAFHSSETSKTGSMTNESNRPDGIPAFRAWDAFSGTTKRNASADTPPGTGLVVEMELRHGGLAVLADGATELRVRFANSVTVAKHARFVVKAGQSDRARVIVERGTARIFVRDGKQEVSPVAGQYVEINKQATGHIVTAIQPVRSNDAEAVAEMATLRFVPTLAEPAAKSPLTGADNSAANQPAAAASTTSTVAAASSSPASQAVSTAMPAALPPSSDRLSTVQPGAVATTPYSAAPLSSLVNIDPLRAPANGANIRGPFTSPEHP